MFKIKMRSNSSSSNDRTFVESLHSISDDTFVVLEGGSEISGSLSPAFSPSIDYEKLVAVTEISKEQKANSRSRDLDDGSYLKKKISFFEKSTDDDRKRNDSNNIESNTSSSLTKIKEKLSFVSKSKSVHLRETFKPDLLYYSDAIHTHSPEEHNHNGGVTYCEAFLQAENISGLTSELLNPVARLDYVESLSCGSHDFQSAPNSPDRTLLSHSRSMTFVNLSPPDYLCSEQPVEDKRISNRIAADSIMEEKCEAHEVAKNSIVKCSEIYDNADLSNDATGEQHSIISVSKVNNHHLDSLPHVSHQLLEWQSRDDNGRPTLVSANSVQELITVSVSVSPTLDSFAAQDASAMESLCFEHSTSADATVDDCSSQYTACTMSSVTTSSAGGVWKHVDENSLALTTLSGAGAGGAIPIVEDIPTQCAIEALSRSSQVTDGAVVGSDPVAADSNHSGRSKQSVFDMVHPQVSKIDSKASSSRSSFRDNDAVSVASDSASSEAKASGSRMGKYLRNLSPLNISQLSKQLLPSNGADKSRKADHPIEKVGSSELQITNIYSSNHDEEVPDFVTTQANPMSTSKNDRSVGHPSSKRFRGLLGDWTYRSIYKSITSPLDYFDRQKVVVTKKVPDTVASVSTAQTSAGNTNYNAKWTSEALTGFDKKLVKRAQAKKLNLAAREDLKILKLTIERWILYEYLLDKVDKDSPLTPDERIEYDLITEEFFHQERVKAFIMNEKNCKMYSLVERAELSTLRLELDRQIRFDGIYRKERHNEPFTFEEKAEYMLLRETLQREQMINQLVDKYKTLLHASAGSSSGEEIDISSHPPDTVDLIVMRIEQDKHKRYEQLVAKEKENKGKIATTCKLSSSSSSKLSLAEKSELVILRKELERQRRQQAEKVARLSQALRNGSSFSSPPHTPLSPCRSPRNAQYAEGGSSSSAVKKNQRQLNTIILFDKIQSTSTSDSSPSSSMDGNGGIASSKSSTNTRAMSTLSGMDRHAATRTASSSSASPYWSTSKSPYRGAMSSLNSPQNIRQAFPVQRLSSIQSSRKNMSEMVLSEFISPLLLYGPAAAVSPPSSEKPMYEESCSGVTSLDASASTPFYTDTHRTEPDKDDADDGDAHPLSAPTNQQQSLVTSSSPSSHHVVVPTYPRASIASSPSLPPQQQRQRQPSMKPPMRPPLPKAQTPSTTTSSSPCPSPAPPRLTFSKMVELSMQQLKSDKERDLSREKQRRLSAFLRNNIDHHSTVADSVAQTMMTRRLSLRSHNENENMIGDR